jgi:thiaminase/transcriptional activator TenA
MMKWSESAWQESNAIYEKIVRHPFNIQLMNGTLPTEIFKFYIAQDSVYLSAFGKALALIAARSNHSEHTLNFIRFSEDALVAERSLHESYFEKFGLSDDATASPTCHHYTQFLLSNAALEPIEVAMAAVLPCFWIYKKVGDHIYKHQTNNNNPYCDWITNYAGEDFSQTVQKAIDVCDEVSTECTHQQRLAMTQAFNTSVKLEWMFWDSAWRQEQWPV